MGKAIISHGRITIHADSQLEADNIFALYNKASREGLRYRFRKTKRYKWALYIK